MYAHLMLLYRRDFLHMLIMNGWRQFSASMEKLFMSGKVKCTCMSLLLICIYFILPNFLSNYKIMDAMITMPICILSWISLCTLNSHIQRFHDPALSLQKNLVIIKNAVNEHFFSWYSPCIIFQWSDQPLVHCCQLCGSERGAYDM